MTASFTVSPSEGPAEHSTLRDKNDSLPNPAPSPIPNSSARIQAASGDALAREEPFPKGKRNKYLAVYIDKADLALLNQKARENHLTASTLGFRLILQGLTREPWLREEERTLLAGAAHDLHRLAAAITQEARMLNAFASVRGLESLDAEKLHRGIQDQLEAVRKDCCTISRIVARANRRAWEEAVEDEA